MNIYAIYSFEDKSSAHRIIEELKTHQNDFDLSFWNDEPIYTGQQWKPQHESRLNEADIFLLLISADFMNSEFIKQLEFKNIIDRYKENKAVVVPIIIEDCQWNINFEADDYTFNFNELQVLPKERKPLINWNSHEEAYADIKSQLRNVISSFSQNIEEEDSYEVAEEEQLAITFTKEKEESEERIQVEAETRKKTEEKAELKRIAEAKRLQEENKVIKKAEEALRLKQEAAIKKREEVEQRLLAKSAAIQKEEEKARKAAAEKLKAIGVNDAVEIKLNKQEQPSNSKRKILAGMLIIALAPILIWAFSFFGKNTDKIEPQIPKTEKIGAKDASPLIKTEIDTTIENEVLSNLSIGSRYNGGLVFEIDSSGKIGKIAHVADTKPIPWKSAMKIHEELGEGWRLPTMVELKRMHKTIGQGATNSGEFSGELYWSATPFDSVQARLVRFRDGDSSYHYNSQGTHRKFRVRAIKEFNR